MGCVLLHGLRYGLCFVAGVVGGKDGTKRPGRNYIAR
jgi:hypothetical protein